MKWLKYPSNFTDDPRVQRVFTKHRSAGYHVLMRMLELMAQNLNSEVPDSFKFDWRFFKGHCFDSVSTITGKKILETVKDLGLILDYWMKDGFIWIDCDLIASWADRYSRAKMERIAKERMKKL